MSSAGRSAQQRYDTLSARYKAGRRGRFIRNVLVATALAIGAVVLLGDQYGPLVPWVIASIYLVAILKSIVEPNHVRAWAIGAEGERITGRDLERLPDGFRVLHDLRIVGSRANVDHVVIGPTGVFVIESKRMRGKLRVRDNEVYVGGRRRRIVDEVRAEVAAVETVLHAAGIAVPVRPVLYIQEVDPPWFLSGPAGIPIVLSGRRLRKLIASGDEVLTLADVERATEALSNGLRRPTSRATPGATFGATRGEPAVAGEGPVLAACPRCGSEMVVRRNRSGEQFLGCSTFPRCRGTLSWPI